MSDRDGIIAAIHAAPDDDAPRLVFADWLDENGQPERAEFIRLQIAMWREYDAHGRTTPRLDAMFLEQKALFKKPWADVLRRCGADAVSHYSRGYATFQFRMPAPTFHREASELFGWFGPTAALALTRCAGALKAVAFVSELRWLHSLSLVGHWKVTADEQFTDEDVEDLCRSPYLGTLRRLQISPPVGNTERPAPGLTARTCAALASATSLTGLRSLTLDDNPVGDDGIALLAKSKGLGTLQSLRIKNTGLTRRGVEALIRAPYLNSLRELTLSASRLNDRLRQQLRERFGSSVEIAAQPRVCRTGG